LLGSISKELWSELENIQDGEYSTRKPLISSLRRNLQREHLERLIDLTLPSSGSSAAYKVIPNLAVKQLRTIKDRIDRVLADNGKMLDPYTDAHLAESSKQIERALEAVYVYNQTAPGAGGPIQLILGQETDQEQSHMGHRPLTATEQVKRMLERSQQEMAAQREALEALRARLEVGQDPAADAVSPGGGAE
jgi:hypothetical protein